ncbi:MAG: type II toxin-antitoxin system RelE/ParE family toxin [Chitinophagaceae bacterium]|nr:type II toxin-antitoxin system RelE/ParE family toxin [Chitinophagaceae bacterium]
MGSRKITVKRSAAENIAAIALYIESKGMVATAEKFADAVYDFFLKLADDRKSYSFCREPVRASLGYKCTSYRRKYTVVFLESDDELIICEFISSRLIHW